MQRLAARSDKRLGGEKSAESARQAVDAWIQAAGIQPRQAPLGGGGGGGERGWARAYIAALRDRVHSVEKRSLGKEHAGIPHVPDLAACD